MSSKQQDYTEYTVDLSQLTKERPLGVTGILRCQNSADFLDACIESCIEGLDELIAVYHNCTDETANILKRKQSKYPYKIKIFEYQPYIYPIDLTDEQFQETMNLPKDSIHLLSGYTNYAISKVTYRYAIKIDSDQLFFSESFKKYCDAYRTEQKVRINPFDIQPARKEYTPQVIRISANSCFSSPISAGSSKRRPPPRADTGSAPCRGSRESVFR